MIGENPKRKGETMIPTCPTCFRILPQCRKRFFGPICECPQPKIYTTASTGEQAWEPPDTGDDSLYNVRRLRAQLKATEAELAIMRANWDAANRDALAAHKLACAAGHERDAIAADLIEHSKLFAEVMAARVDAEIKRDEWRACAVALARDLRGCAECCDLTACVCRDSLAEFDRLTKPPTP